MSVKNTDFRKELESLINRHSLEGSSDTPDFILANYIMSCLSAFNSAVRRREEWYGRAPKLTLAAVQSLVKPDYFEDCEGGTCVHTGCADAAMAEEEAQAPLGSAKEGDK